MGLSSALTTYLDVALASIQTTMIEIESTAGDGTPNRVVEAFCELEQAYARVLVARKMLLR